MGGRSIKKVAPAIREVMSSGVVKGTYTQLHLDLDEMAAWVIARSAQGS